MALEVAAVEKAQSTFHVRADMIAIEQTPAIHRSQGVRVLRVAQGGELAKLDR